MEIFKKPDTVFSLSALAIAGASATYSYKKLQELTDTVNKLTDQVNAIGKNVGNIKPIHEKTIDLDSVIHELDRTLSALKKEFEETLELQQADNQVLEDYINNVVKTAELPNVQELQLENIEEVQPKKRGKKKKRGVRFARPQRDEPSEDDEDEVSGKLERLRRRRG
jgi:hypothetical protein